MYGCDLRAFVHDNIGCGSNTTDQVVGHRRSESTSHKQVNGTGAATFSQEHCRLPGGVSASHDRDILCVIEDGLDSSARIVNSGRFKTVHALGIELAPVDAGGNQHGASTKQGPAVQMQ